MHGTIGALAIKKPEDVLFRALAAFKIEKGMRILQLVLP